MRTRVSVTTIHIGLGTLTAATPAQKFNGFETNVKNRCPGGVTQPSADGSSPFSFGGCDAGASP